MSEDVVLKAIENAPALAATWIVGRPLLDKFLGPTAEYLGGVNAQLAKKAVENIDKVFKKALDKTGARIDSPGQVPPKVLKSILDNAAYSEDEIAASYYGGVLASSRTGISRDDRGATFSSLIGDLSSYQLRSHYIFYALLLKCFDGSQMNPGMQTDRTKMKIAIPFKSFMESMDFQGAEDVNAILPHIFSGLVSRGLIDQQYAYGDAESVKSAFSNVSDSFFGLTYQPSTLGIELFLWAHGRGDIPVNNSFYYNLSEILEEEIKLPNDIVYFR